MPEYSVPPGAPLVDYNAYVPRDSECEYSLVDVTCSGSVVARQVLDKNLEHYLANTLQSNVNLWNGLAGLRGIAYSAKGPKSSGSASATLAELTPGDLNAFTGSLKMLSQVGEDSSRHKKLRKDLDVHAKIATELESAASQQSRKISVLKAICAKGSSDSNDGKESINLLTSSSIGSADGNEEEKRLGLELAVGMLTLKDLKEARAEYAEAVTELKDLTDALARSHAKTAVIREELDEVDTATFRQAAILERVFGHDPAGNFAIDVLISNKSRSDAVKAKSEKAVSLAASRNDSFVKHYRILRVHIDAKKGLVHLHALESVLKTVLEHLSGAMSAATGGPRVANKAPDNIPISPTYRIRYVRKLRESADRVLPDIARYAPFCELKIEGVPLSVALQSVEKEGGGTKHAVTLLPKFSKLALAATSFKTKDKITMLYNDAKEAYAHVNVAYDRQKALTEKTTAHLLEASEKLQQEEADLSALRFRILVTKSIGAKVHRTLTLEKEF